MKRQNERSIDAGADMLKVIAWYQASEYGRGYQLSCGQFMEPLQIST